jgi:hypothetical protein
MPQISIKKKVFPIQAKTLSLCLKIRDEFYATLLDQDNQTILDYEGYVPSFMPGDHYGDYLLLDIDLDTGVIKNWRVPQSSEIEDWIEKNAKE